MTHFASFFSRSNLAASIYAGKFINESRSASLKLGPTFKLRQSLWPCLLLLLLRLKNLEIIKSLVRISNSYKLIQERLNAAFLCVLLEIQRNFWFMLFEIHQGGKIGQDLLFEMVLDLSELLVSYHLKSKIS